MTKEETKTAGIGCKCKTIKINIETRDTAIKEEKDTLKKLPHTDENKA